MREVERGIPKGGLRYQAGKMEGERESETEMEKREGGWRECVMLCMSICV
jgi:hypothetical protein